MPEKIRVLELVVSTDLGGGPIHVRDLLAGLPLEEFEVTVAGPGGGPLEKIYRELGVEFVDLPLNRLSPVNLFRVRRLIRDRRIQVVHSHGKGAGLFGRLGARWAGVPAVHTFHGIHAEYMRLLRPIYAKMEQRLASTTDTIIHVSAGQAREARKLEFQPTGSTEVIVNATDYERVRLFFAHGQQVSREKLGLPPNSLILGTVARFDPVKAIDVLVEAFAILAPKWPEANLLIVGDGPELSKLESLAEMRGVRNRVVFAGLVPDAPRYLPAMDLYVSASHREGLPLSLLEAMVCGLPIVATRIPGHEDVVVDNVTGLMVPPNDPRALADAAARLLAEPERRRRMGEAFR